MCPLKAHGQNSTKLVVLVKPAQLAADRSTFKNHQPHLTQQVDLVQGCWKKRAETYLASYC